MHAQLKTKFEKIHNTANNTLGWYASDINEPDEKLIINAYRDHHPLNTPTNASTSSSFYITVSYDHDTNTFVFSTLSDVKSIPEDAPDIETQTRTILNHYKPQADAKSILTLAQNELAGAIGIELSGTFQNAYDVLTADTNELTDIDGIDETDAETLQTQPNKYSASHESAARTICPNCSEEFWSGISTADEPTIDDIKTRTYCPACEHNDIPATHINTPVEFTNDTILTD